MKTTLFFQGVNILSDFLDMFGCRVDLSDDIRYLVNSSAFIIDVYKIRETNRDMWLLVRFDSNPLMIAEIYDSRKELIEKLKRLEK